MSEVKFCPFCGGEVIEPDLEDGDCVYWIDHDESCFLKIKEVSTFFDIYLEAWNTRHEETCDGCKHLATSMRVDYHIDPCCECVRNAPDLYEPKEGADADGA